MTGFFDDRETRSADQRAAENAQRLPAQLAHAKRHAPAYAALLADLDPREANLAALPVTRKSDLIAAQAAAPPFGGFTAVAVAAVPRVFASPGPIHEPQGAGADPWRYARALHATGLRPGMLLHNCFAYHFTPAGMMLEEGARALGCPVFPAGPGNTESQARAAAHLRPGCYSGTPDFLRTILEAGDALGLDLSCLRFGHVTGGAFLPALRSFYAARGLVVQQSYGTADLGLIAYESEAGEGLICDEDVLVEIVHPGTGEPLPEGEVGEVLVTTFSATYPLIRFATGDLSAVLPGASPCGRSNTRLRGWMGRADQAAKVRGMFVRPEQVAEVMRAHPGLGRARLVIGLDGMRDTMLLRVEAPVRDAALVQSLTASLQAVTRLRGTVDLLEPGALPNDGKVIDDTRPA
ncbi:phenylacetate--CoA ligase family protein [Falsiroseomonas selenitidurans]|uniref:Phenylacetate--CoA ligase n=1 Tax=Falsiroseomonas selenitidurans TaxID=2716335 RepID=A0ABX1E141_9PROT|nr:phenylacetate--CoA ligase [Falsiroseomonas selenitidurans]NKC30869.1 phenylacetate--CoA ligase [Falsiroseomonas selenitidurans]